MARPPASSARPADPKDLAVLPSAGELPEAAAATPPEWVRIAPAGELKCRDGRSFTLDPAALVRRFDAEKVEVPIDLGHATVNDAKAPALGWIDRLEARSDGLWGHVREWLRGGREVLTARTHRYVSPAFHHDDKGAAVWLHSVALVAAPALAMGALLHARVRPDDVGLAGELAAALGLDAGASRATCLAVVAELRTTAVPLAEHQSTLATLAAVRGQLATLQAKMHADKVDAFMEGALKALKIVPAERASLVQLSATPEGFSVVERLVASRVPQLGPSALDGRAVAGMTGPAASTPEALAAAATALITERRAKGLPEITYADAMTRVVNNPSRD